MNTLKFLFVLITMCVIYSHAKPLDTTRTIQVSQLESTVALLKDSVRLNSLIQDLEAVIRAQHVVQDTDTVSNRLNTILPEKFDSQILYKIVNKVIGLLSNVQMEITDYSRIISQLQIIPAYSNSTEFLFFITFLIVAVVAGTLVWGSLKKVGNRLRAKGHKENAQKRWIGYAFLFIDRVSVPAGLSVAAIILSFPFGRLSPGVLFMHLSVALLIYSFGSSVLEMLFSKKFPQFCILTSESVFSKSVLKAVSSVLTLALTFWLIYRTTQFAGWVSTSSLIAAFYKVLLTFQLTHLTYRNRALFSSFRSGVSLGSVSDAVVKSFRFVFRWLFIPVFLVCTILTITSLSSDRTFYHYFLNAAIQSVLLFAGVIIVVLLLMAVLKHIARLNQNAELEKSYTGQLLMTNKRTIEYTGFILIVIAGLSLLVKIWGFDMYRIIQSDIPVVAILFHIVCIIAGAVIAMQFSQLLIKGFLTKAQKQMLQSGTTEIEIKKRIDTLGGIFQKISAVTIGVVAVIMVIDELGFDIKAMLAGVGIVGIAVGFGAQNLVRDIISGLFVIFENRIRVGDVAIINGTGGLVEQVNLRTIVLRSMDGTIHVFSNGAINSLSNMTHEFSYYVFDIGIAYKENVDNVIEILKQVGSTMINDTQFNQAILAPLEILGLDKFGTSEIVIKARIKTVPIKQWDIGREMNKRIKDAFDREGIEIPFPHQSIYFGENSKPVRVKMEL